MNVCLRVTFVEAAIGALTLPVWQVFGGGGENKKIMGYIAYFQSTGVKARSTL